MTRISVRGLLHGRKRGVQDTETWRIDEIETLLDRSYFLRWKSQDCRVETDEIWCSDGAFKIRSELDLQPGRKLHVIWPMHSSSTCYLVLWADRNIWRNCLIGCTLIWVPDFHARSWNSASSRKEPSSPCIVHAIVFIWKVRNADRNLKFGLTGLAFPDLELSAILWQPMEIDLQDDILFSFRALHQQTLSRFTVDSVKFYFHRGRRRIAVHWKIWLPLDYARESVAAVLVAESLTTKIAWWCSTIWMISWDSKEKIISRPKDTVLIKQRFFHGYAPISRNTQ